MIIKKIIVTLMMFACSNYIAAVAPARSAAVQQGRVVRKQTIDHQSRYHSRTVNMLTRSMRSRALTGIPFENTAALLCKSMRNISSK